MQHRLNYLLSFFLGAATATLGRRLGRQRNHQQQGELVMTSEQEECVRFMVDACSDIRAVYGALALRRKKGKLSEVEELEEEQDTSALSALETELDTYFHDAKRAGVSQPRLLEICKSVLPKERYEQLHKRKTAVAA